MSNKIKVLIVDDTNLHRKIISSALEEKGFQVVCVESGVHCFEALLTDRPNVILLDIEMPEINGKDVLTEIRKKYNKLELPVIMITAKSDVSDIAELLSIGANDYVTKSVNFEVLVMRIMTHVEMGAFSRKMNRLNKLEGISAIIATYHHEINNGLTIALGHLATYTKINQHISLEKLDAALWRTVEVVKKIEAVTHQEDVEYVGYPGSSKMLKL